MLATWGSATAGLIAACGAESCAAGRIWLMATPARRERPMAALATAPSPRPAPPRPLLLLACPLAAPSIVALLLTMLDISVLPSSLILPFRPRPGVGPFRCPYSRARRAPPHREG